MSKIVSFRKVKEVLFDLEKRFPKYKFDIKKSYKKDKKGYESFSVDTASNSILIFHHFPKSSKHNDVTEITTDIETEYYGKVVQRDIERKHSYINGIRQVLYSLHYDDVNKLLKEKPEYRKYYSLR